MQLVGRDGEALIPDPFFEKLTGVTAARFAREGRPLTEAVDDFARFAEGAMFWSWGKDELNLMAISCYIAGVVPILLAHRFGNVCSQMLHAGMPYDVNQKTRSHDLPARLGLGDDGHKPHDALSDAMQLVRALQYVMAQGRLDLARLSGPLQPPGA